MRHTPRPSRIVQLGDLDIYRIEVLTKRHWWNLPTWQPLLIPRVYDESYGMTVFEGTLPEAHRQRESFIKDEWEAIYRTEDNWITVEDKETL